MNKELAIKILCGETLGTTEQTNEAVKMAIEALTAQRKKGKWVDEPVYRQTMDGKTWDGYTYCSECREMLHKYGYRSKYCPDCGAYMREKDEE